jgi:hypothetical protein
MVKGFDEQTLKGSQTSPRRLASGRLRRASRFGANSKGPRTISLGPCPAANFLKQAAPANDLNAGFVSRYVKQIIQTDRWAKHRAG